MADIGLSDHYQVLEELGRGSFGVVYKGVEKATGETVAIKHIDLESNDDDIQDIQAEIAVLSTCASPYVTQYKASFLRGHKLWIVMEYLGGGSCLDLLKPANFSEAHIAIICRELLLGIQYLHSEGKIHRDVKAANVLLSEAGKVKLADFGVAAQLTNIKSQRNTFVGTPFWMAPEVIQQDGYSFKADIWSLGITAMELANGEPPLAHIHPMKVLFHIPKNPPPALDANFSRDFRDFVAQCLTKEYDQRPTAKDLLRHRFIRSAGKVEALQELMSRKRMWDANQNRQKHPIYYQETLQTLSLPKDDDDEWIFDTVKSTAPPPPPLPLQQQQQQQPQPQPKRPVVKQRKPSSALSVDESMHKLDLKDAPLGASSPAGAAGTVRRTTVRRTPSLAQVSAMHSAGGGSVRGGNSVRNRSVRNDSSPRPSVAPPKKPLQPDMSFGNSGSTMRLFRRVPSDGSTSGQTGRPTSPDDVFCDENAPPTASSSSPITPVEPYGKEAILGRRLYSRAIEPSLTELHAQTSAMHKRDALAKLTDAFAALDMVDPEGAYHLMSNVVASMTQDKKLNSALLNNNPAMAGFHSAVSSTPAGKMLPDDGTPQGTVIVKSATPNSNSHASHASHASHVSVSSVATSNGSPSKLILSSNNPHLKSHRRRQGGSPGPGDAAASPREKERERSLLESKYPGREAKPGMEHSKLLSDVLYNRWAEGLRVRWPGT